MKNKKLFLRDFLVLLTSACVLGTAALAERLVIQDYVVKVRKVPSLTGPSIGELKHNQKVEEVERRNNFVKIKTSSLEGWIPLSAVIGEKKLSIKKGKKVDAVSDNDVLAAGKGLGDTSGEISEGKADEARGQKYLDEVEATTETKDSDIKKFKLKGGLKPGQKTKGGK